MTSEPSRTSSLALAALLALSPVASAQTYKKPLKGPQLEGPVSPQQGRDQAAPETSDAPLANGTDRAADSAYGAFQRGFYLTALRLALPRAETGDPAAQTLIAEIYWNGFGVARDTKKALEWYRFAANGGNREAQFALANILLKGDTVPADKKAGRALMEKAAAAGHSRAQFNLAQIIVAERPTWQGYKRAMPWYQKAAEAGVPDAQYAMANIHAEAQGVTVNNEVLARQWLSKAAQAGMPIAQLEYGIWLANGRGGAKDEKEALQWFGRAARQRNVVAQNRLARMYAFGIGTTPDVVKAGAWHVVARRAGHTDVQLDRRFADMSPLDRKRAIDLANRLTQRLALR
ncbi:tetratricopeptide repeat protein [Pseudahrensia aquimaris]|uniref:Tetratricopeptide repeat protein n=1 Tax=Pseudahrensia aquimaris TaxID=744461 RepID=A0ABW3FFI6_9HYPH